MSTAEQEDLEEYLSYLKDEVVPRLQRERDKLRSIAGRSISYIAEWVAELKEQHKAWEGRDRARYIKKEIDEGEAILAEIEALGIK